MVDITGPRFLPAKRSSSNKEPADTVYTLLSTTQPIVFDRMLEMGLEFRNSVIVMGAYVSYLE